MGAKSLIRSQTPVSEQVHVSPALRGELRAARTARWPRSTHPFSKLSRRMAIDFLVIMNMELLDDRW